MEASSEAIEQRKKEFELANEEKINIETSFTKTGNLKVFLKGIISIDLRYSKHDTGALKGILPFDNWFGLRTLLLKIPFYCSNMIAVCV